MNEKLEEQLARAMALAEAMAVWPVAHDGVDIELRDWSLRRTEEFGVHLVGYNIAHREGRVSSALASFDVATRVAVSSGGNRYLLVGRPGCNLDAEYVWSRWCGRNAVAEWKDVTHEVIERGLCQEKP